MSISFGRKFVLGLGLCASLFASASAYGIGGSAESVIIVCPQTVLAGSPILGYLTGGDVPLNATGMGRCGNLPGSPVLGFLDPTFFTFWTFEPMKGSVVTITAGDSSGHSATATVVVL